MFDLRNEYIKGVKNNKKKKHGILLITTKDYFFVLPEIKNVEECFTQLKNLINYNPTQKENEKNDYKDFIDKMYSDIMKSKNKEDLGYYEERFISLVNMMEGLINIEKDIQYLEELGAFNIVNLLKEKKEENIDESKIDSKDFNVEDDMLELLNKIKLLDEQEPFYEKYLVPFAKEHLQEYIK